MDSFNELLHKIRDAHERELEGWQLRVQELSNKKGCDIKRMEELFNRNQLMKEQQRVLTENIKTLENRLRAGLCDRCTVTQEVAKRRQHEYESSQIQSLHQFSILVGEMNNLKKDNRRLREELANHRKALDSQSTAPEVKASTSPDLSPSAAVVSLTATTGSNTSKLPEGGSVAVKMEADQRFEDSHTQLGASSRRHFESYKPLEVHLTPLVLPPRGPEESRSAGDKRLQGFDGPTSPTSDPPQHAKFLKNTPVPRSSSSSSSAAIREISVSRHVLHAPVPCRPRPIKSGALSFPWSVSEHPDWAGAAGHGQAAQPDPLKSNPFLFTNPGAAGPQPRPGGPAGSQPRQEVRVSAWPKQEAAPPDAREPDSRLVRVRSLSELGDSQAIALERKEMAPIQWRNPGTGRPHRAVGAGPGEPEGTDRPLDLSERGRSRSNGSANSEQSVFWQGPEGADEGLESSSNTSPRGVPPSPGRSPTSAPSSPAQDVQKPSDHSHMDEERDQSVEKNRSKADQSIKEDVPVVSISLQPVVLLGILNPALQKQGPSFSNGKLKPLDPSSSLGEPDEEGLSLTGEDPSPASKRSMSSTDQHSSRESDNEDPRSQKRLKIQVGFQD